MQRIAVHILVGALLFPMLSIGQFTVNPTVTNSNCPDDSTGSISLVVSGGSSPYTFLWSPGGELSSSVTGLVPGVYGVTITDNSGADTTLSFSVGPDAFQNDTTNGKVNTPFCTSNGHIIMDVTGGTAPYQYAWNDGSSGIFITQLGAGDYSVIVTDANTCSTTFNFHLEEATCFVTPDPYFTPNGDGINDTWTIAESQYFPDAHVVIFDRWGVRVYDHKGTYEPWDGKSNLGVPVPDAAYYYFFYQDKDDKQKASKNGSVIILR